MRGCKEALGEVCVSVGGGMKKCGRDVGKCIGVWGEVRGNVGKCWEINGCVGAWGEVVKDKRKGLGCVGKVSVSVGGCKKVLEEVWESVWGGIEAVGKY